MTQKPDILIIGAGLSGLICAKILQEKGVPYLLVENPMASADESEPTK